MSLTALFVRRPTLIFVLLALMLLAGALAATTLVQQQFPNVSQPTISINVSDPGASTSVMRDSIVKPIEDAIAGTQDLQTLSSNIQSGQASISAAFVITSDQNTDLVNTQKALTQAEHNLPTTLQPPTLAIRDPSEAVVVTIGLTSSKMTAAELSLIANGRIVPYVEQVPDVSGVNVGGSVTPAYEVVADPAKISAYNLTLNDLISTVGASNTRAPGGIAYEQDRETQIDIRGDITSPESLLGLPISAPSSNTGTPLAGLDPWTSATQVLRVGDVASVVDGYEPRRQYASINGDRGRVHAGPEGLGCFRGHRLEQRLGGAAAHPGAVPRHQLQRHQRPVQVHRTADRQRDPHAERGHRLTGIVMLFFLGSWRNAIVVLVAIPSSLCVALFVMKMMGLTIDTISLLGMTLVVGILVDDSTVVLENIERHHEMGQPPAEAAVTGRSEIGMAAIVITLVDVVVFLPIAFLQGQVGRNLAEFGIVVVISTLTSLFVSFTITPSLAGNWALKGHWKPPWFIRKFEQGFSGRAQLVRASRAAMGLADALPGDRVLPAVVRRRDAAGAVRHRRFGVRPAGRPRRDLRADHLSGRYAAHHRRRGGAQARARDSRSARHRRRYGRLRRLRVAVRRLPPRGQRRPGPRLAQRRAQARHELLGERLYRRLAAKTLPNTQVVVIPATGTGGGNAQPIDELVTDVQGGDPTKYADQVYKLMQQTPGTANVYSAASSLEPQVELTFDRAKARALNVSIGDATTRPAPRSAA
jgi:multidrug efflux pump subunit AcrB